MVGSGINHPESPQHWPESFCVSFDWNCITGALQKKKYQPVCKNSTVVKTSGHKNFSACVPGVKAVHLRIGCGENGLNFGRIVLHLN
jgi:hypothetical protein